MLKLKGTELEETDLMLSLNDAFIAANRRDFTLIPSEEKVEWHQEVIARKGKGKYSTKLNEREERFDIFERGEPYALTVRI